MIALDGRFGYSFLLGIGAAINPCGFVLLPAYLMYFLGMEGSRPGTQRASLQRALLVSAAMSAGFITVFLVVGTVTRLFTSVIEENAKYAGFVIGIALIVLGCFMLAGWKPAFALPQINTDYVRRQTFVSMFGFGVAYAVASIGCALPFLVAAIFGSFGVHGFLSGVLSVVLYGAGMALLVDRAHRQPRVRERAVCCACSAARCATWTASPPSSSSSPASISRGTGTPTSPIAARDGLKSRAERWQSRLLNFFTDRGAWKLCSSCSG